jgi:molybdenum cofactor cytidylyltransferase
MKNLNENKLVSALILAAGNSSRMKEPKPLLQFDSKFRFIDKITNEYMTFGCNEIIIVINNTLENLIKPLGNIKIIVNNHIEYGRFYSIKTGLDNLIENEFCFIQNSDNPYVNINVLKILYAERGSADCIIPSYRGRGGHPVLIGKEVIDRISLTEDNDLNFREFLKQFKCKKIEVEDEMILININTPDEYGKNIRKNS